VPGSADPRSRPASPCAPRAGIEGTLSQAVRRCGLRRSRYIGLARTHLAHILTATAVNVVRVGKPLADTPRAKTRHPPFATVLAPPEAA
jgi:transposase